MNKWRFFATKLDGLGGESLVHPELPVSTVSPSRVLSGTNQVDLTIPIHDDSLMDWATGQPTIVPWQTMIYAERSGVIITGGIVRDIEPMHGELSIRCVGMTDYLSRVFYGGDLKVYETDPMDITRLMWTYAQSRPRGNLGVFHDTNTSSVTVGRRAQPAFRGRPAIYDENGVKVWSELPPTEEVKDEPYQLAWHSSSHLSDEFRKLAKETPFDYIEKHYWGQDERTIHHRVITRFPSIQRRLGQEVKFIVGENVVIAPKLTDSAEFFTSDVWVLGAGEGSNMVFGSSNRQNHDRLYAHTVVTDGSVTNKDQAALSARGELGALSGGIDIDEIVVRDHDLARFGTYDVGDIVRMRIASPWYGEHEFSVRILEIRYHCDEGDTCTLKVKREDYRDGIL